MSLAEEWNCCWMIRKFEENGRVYITFHPPTMVLVRPQRSKRRHTTEEPKEEKPRLDHIRATQNWTAHTRGLSNPFGAADSSLNGILEFGRFGIVLTRYARENDDSRVARVGVDATLPFCTGHFVRRQLRTHLSKALQWNFC